MALLIGVLLALAVCLLGRFARMDRDRAFYAVMTMVVGSYYVLFAAMGATTATVIVESMLAALFLAAAVAGFRWSLWILVVALAAHGTFDFFHEFMIANAGVPRWWPFFCLAFDVTAAAYLAVLLLTRRLAPAPG